MKTVSKGLARRLGRWLVLAAIACVPIAAMAQVAQPSWGGYARNAQHTALASVGTQPLARIRWRTSVDLRPQLWSGSLLIHYGSPLITQANTVLVPVKRTTTGGFRVEAFSGSDGRPLWKQTTRYELPPHDWVPSFSPALSSTGKLWIPGEGGTLYARTSIDVRGRARKQQVAFFGDDAYRRDRRAYRTNVFINTPITADGAGNVFFGFQVTGPTPTGLQSGIARVADDGAGSWVAASTASGDPAITKVAHNAAPALSNDGSTLYVAVNDGIGIGFASGYLLALDSHSLATIAVRRLRDPLSQQSATIPENGTSSPTVGPDGDVYFGVLENPFGLNHFRGWLLHFDAGLQPRGAPGAFGWDDTASVVPASIVAAYHGSSAYLLMTKYNNYAGAGGDGVNRIAVLDPNGQVVDPISGATVMREVITVAGPTPDPGAGPGFPNAVREWCINTAAVDPVTKSILANSEDGKLYRWSMTTGALTESIVLTAGLLEAYTPTLVGPDGTVYAINDATLFAVGQ
jgi:hypothetical protein